MSPITAKCPVFSSVTARLVPFRFNELRYVAEMAWKRSSVRSRPGPPINPLQIKHMREAEHSLPSMTLCQFVSRALKLCADC